MNPIPELKTNRLTLRPFTLADAPMVQKLAGEYEVARRTLNIPYPYEDGVAEKWISKHADLFAKMEQVIFAIIHRSGNYLIGAIGLSSISQEHETGEVGYWIGKPYWNQGYCTEALAQVLRYGFEELGLNRIYARHFKSNPASGRVLQKVHMRYEGCQRQQFKKFGQFEDVELYGILRHEFWSR
ncbi:MAG: GNAT family N-acetyltransferase [candidate division KSB1 bacterium]|nr:GNAT family N-acetyltransferase [candidate division KSB1 bacterium]MDZ7358332.1 GNAT family N-acetyltransferase [candidate division KSB1 bacterium]MDZ7399133.1 GNAT family N-acetyltransferase [candidate division KSB1 bacterium]